MESSLPLSLVLFVAFQTRILTYSDWSVLLGSHGAIYGTGVVEALVDGVMDALRRVASGSYQLIMFVRAAVKSVSPQGGDFRGSF